MILALYVSAMGSHAPADPLKRPAVVSPLSGVLGANRLAEQSALVPGSPFDSTGLDIKDHST